jgi:CHAD domain-containing protein
VRARHQEGAPDERASRRHATQRDAGIAPLQVVELGKRLRELQDVLGRLNDGRVADALVDDLLAHVEPSTQRELARAAGLVSGWAHRRALADREQIERRWRRVAKLAPYWR